LLHDLCEGGPPKGRKTHKGYGNLPIDELIGLHIKEWLDAHDGWDGTRRAAVQAIRRAVFYCKELGVVNRNPFAGFKAGTAGKRVAYFSREQEAAIDKHASRALGEAIRVMIETGVRPGELAHLEARHVEETEQGQTWRFTPDEHKTGWKTKKDRVVPMPPEIAAIVRQKIKKYPKGKLFRNSRGAPWTSDSFRAAFARLRKKLEKEGIKLDKDNTLYACRHTYAKRMLAKGVTMENLAAKMGNTPQVCYDHYGKDWDRQKDNAPALWEGLD
jgi:integrase